MTLTIPIACRSFVLALSLLIVGACSAGAQGRPNIVLVVVDDLRFDDIGAAGHPFSRTPNIDRLAREGAQFQNMFAVTPLCSPSRANILTGLYTRHHGILDNTDRSPRSHELQTFARQLHAGGYTTGFIGKWHMGNDPTPRPGFDYWAGMKGQGEAIDPELTNTAVSRGSRATSPTSSPSVRELHPRTTHESLPPDAVAQGAPSQHASAGGWHRRVDRRGRLHSRGTSQAPYAGAPLPRRANYGVAPRGKPALERRIEGLPPLGSGTVTPDERSATDCACWSRSTRASAGSWTRSRSRASSTRPS